MDYRSVLRVAALLSFLIFFLGAVAALAKTPDTVSGPHTSQNLSVYFVHGPSKPGPVPLTLAEALERGTVDVIETGSVHRLTVRNRGDLPVFIQRGDIVKGGRQDRVLTVSMLVPAHSKPVPIGSLCVERDRWSKRGAEEVGRFSSAYQMLPSKSGRLALASPHVVEPSLQTRSEIVRRLAPFIGLPPRGESSPRTPSTQDVIWRNVIETQKKLSASVGKRVAASESESSLQLTLEDKTLNRRVESYTRALMPAPQGRGDIVGMVFAVNGKIDSADIYPSNGLFLKMWPKLLRLAATEAVGEAATKSATLPTTAGVRSFLRSARDGRSFERKLPNAYRMQTLTSEESVRSATVDATGSVIHMGLIAR